ncbi:ornithine cyclodeaminase family protein [Acidaminobacter sp. JC074]|uniref:ornithine cyclodeaminase family protein n=1 Tax=Acidaminobacter sp. JC074 TaxID=2530199 RepID=UPI001F0F13EA|nr:hypothetical protein [Acidaminobacter sp. JC074]MCH4886920.1 ornithine cyclodeaminase family protein [Acidaminobacter sp. JC074]
MLYLSKKDLLDLLDCNDIISAIERAYDIQDKGNFIMPDRMHIHYDDNTLLYMPCVIESSYATKLVSVFPGNKDKNLPVVDGIVVLNDKHTGVVNAMIDGQVLTAIRTGAVGGTAVKHLAKEDVKVLGVIGCGVQGYYQALFASQVRDFDEVIVYDAYGYNPLFKETFDNLSIAGSPNELVEKADVIITATTSHDPIFDTDKVKGKTFVGIGSFKPNMREYSDAFLKHMDHILVDTPFAKDETGDLKLPLEDGIISESDIQLFSPKFLEGTVFFKSVGMALFDNVVAEKLYLKAVELKKGIELEA